MVKKYEETGINAPFVFKLTLFLIVTIVASLFISSKYFFHVKRNIVLQNNSNAISAITKDFKLKDEIALKKY